VLLDGRAVATWRSTRRRDQISVSIEPFGELAPDAVAALQDEARDVGRFQGCDATMQIGG
jgi:hypothetical protein